MPVKWIEARSMILIWPNPISLKVFIIAGILVCLALGISWVQKKSLLRELGLDIRQWRWYIDVGLGCVAIVSTQWAIAFAYEPGAYNLRRAIRCALVAALCFALAKDKLDLSKGVVGLTTIVAWYVILLKHESRGLWVAFPATLLWIIILRISRGRAQLER